MSKIPVSLIVAFDDNMGIGKDNQIPWSIKEDTLFFQDITKFSPQTTHKNAVIYGKNTWYSFDEKNRGLKDRVNFVISSTLTQDKINNENTSQCEVYIVPNLEELIKDINTGKYGNIYKIFICGGKSVYEESIKLNLIQEWYITHIHHKYDCDVKLDSKLESKLEGSLNNPIIHKFKVYDNKLMTPTEVSFIRSTLNKRNPEEDKYLDLLYQILKTGHYRQTRNEFTYSVFGKTLEFDLSQGFPLLTTKKMFTKGIIEELLWFLKGDTNSNNLSSKGVKIWESNTSKEFLDKSKLDYDVGDMGPMYGFQWRHFNAEYKGMDKEYKGHGFDQIEYCLNLIKNDPYSRRILMTTYNPLQASHGVLYPCHGISVIFNVEEGNKLSCMMTQRSADQFLGV